MTEPDTFDTTPHHRVGWIGLGVMGTPMCGHLLAAGHPTTVHSRRRVSADEALARGASWGDDPAAVAAVSDVVFVMVGHPHDVEQVVLGERGVLAGARPGTLLVDMTTSRPSLAVEVAEAAAGHGCLAVDAPVSGGDVGAREARLSIMVGGTDEAVARARPLLDLLGTTVVHHGGPGAGQHTKMVNQTLVAAGMVGVCEALLYAHRAGLDLERVLESVSSGAAGSWALSNLAPRILRGDLQPGFYVEHLVKDLRIVLAESERMGLAVPGVALASQLYTALVGQGHGRLGTQSLVLALASLSGIDWTHHP